MLETKEFYEIMDAFEKASRNLYIRIGSMGLKREDKENWENGYYYSDGEANSAFKIFMHGVSFGKCFYSN